MSKSAWLIRPFPDGKDSFSAFVANSMIAIGWSSYTSDLTFKDKKDIKNMLSSSSNKLDGLTLGIACATIDLFVNKMSEGDLLLMPYNEDIYLGTIKSGYFYNKSENSKLEGFPHQRIVVWNNHCLRKDLSPELRIYLKVHRTVANLSHYYEEILDLIKGVKIKRGSNSRIINLAYPLRTDFNVTFCLPKDTTKEEAQRLSDYIRTLYFTTTKKELIMTKVPVSTKDAPHLAHLESVITPLRYKYSGLTVNVDDSTIPFIAEVKGHIGYLFIDSYKRVQPMHFDACIELDDNFPNCNIKLSLKSTSQNINNNINRFINNNYQLQSNHKNLKEWFEEIVEPSLDKLGNYLMNQGKLY